MHVWFVVLPETLLLDLAGPAEAYRLANQQRARQGRPPLFVLHYVGPQAQTDSSVGVALAGLAPLPTTLPAPSWVLLLGRPGDGHAVVRAEPPWLATRRWIGQVLAPALLAPGSPHRLMTVCSGALLLADAGLAAGRCLTTHHELLDELQALAPAARVLGNRVFVQDGPLWTSAGVTAGIDLALHSIAEVGGEALAAAVAQVLVVFQRRAGEAPQQSPLLASRSHLHPAVHKVQNAVNAEPAADWTAERLAAVAHVTPRHLGRLFQQHAGLSPRDYVARVRAALVSEAVRGGQPLKQALATQGFGSARAWRRALDLPT
ncbi:GlxA family transcriptional regulator [Ideonella livida]|uniref:Helix-turn-helix domain-containing protein n=1 Tax=Ideonella livida TaxID=2707176 RepID=A0A7C9PIZ7_9BURK|nr:helix-turn-helix domain-containing protein [Ideonella livida]NDY92374.1 helix-turn-helix domain-containing protein [Ideonella livida]